MFNSNYSLADLRYFRPRIFVQDLEGMLQPIPQFLHKEISRWTGQSIFDCQMINLMNLLAVCVRELAAGLGTDIVDRAEIVPA